MNNALWRTAVALVVSAALVAGLPANAEPAARARAEVPEFSLLGRAQRIDPVGAINGAVVLFSGSAGWGEDERELARWLSARGKLVFGIDSPATLARIEASKDDCVILIGEIEALSHQSQRTLDTAAYHFPLLAGIGEGAALALAVAGQAEAATIAGVLAVDPPAVLPARKPFCSDAPRRASADGVIYHLPPGRQPFPVDIELSAAATGVVRTHSQALADGHAEVRLSEHAASPLAALQARIEAPRPQVADALDDLPLVELPAQDASEVFAVFYSGDGGWRDLDKDLAAILQAEQVPVVGVDVLRYFWRHRDAGEAAVDLARIIRGYQQKWKARKVLLIGYSFGADVLPALYNRLDAAERASVVQISLLGLADSASFEVSVSNWLNHDAHALPTAGELARISPALMQCFYGIEDEGAACPAQEKRGVEIIRTSGGHHFDGDYAALARRVLEGLKRRNAEVVKTAADTPASPPR